MTRDPATWPLWGVTAPIPVGLTPADLGDSPRESQCRLLVRARSRAAAARAIVAATGGSVGETDRWLRDYGCPSGVERELAAVVDDRVHVSSHNSGRVIIPVPPH